MNLKQACFFSEVRGRYKLFFDNGIQNFLPSGKEMLYPESVGLRKGASSPFPSKDLHRKESHLIQVRVLKHYPDQSTNEATVIAPHTSACVETAV